MTMLKIKDNSRTNKAEFSNIKNITNKIADRTFEQLEREGILIFPPLVHNYEDITKDQMILQSINDCYYSGNVMGFIGYGKERLVIESRFCNENNDYFLQYLLCKVMNLPNIVDLSTDADQENKLFNLLVFLFPHYLKTATRKGLFKTYIRKEYNNANLKGNIDIARHIKSNTPFTGNIAYSQREYSYDNDLIELVRHTIEFIKKKPYGYNLLTKVKDEIKLIIDATPTFEQCDRQKIILKNKENSLRHAYYHEYRALQRICLLILQQQKHQIGSEMRQIYGILFDGAWLWEEYIYSLVKDYFYHPMNKSHKGAQCLFKGNIGLIYPDFICRKENQRIIADAKYKPIDNIGNRDYLQVLAYMFRFDAKKGYYFYPEVNGVDDLQLWLNKGSTYEENVEHRHDVCVTKHGLKIPIYTNSYETFVSTMQENEKEFMKIFSNL